MKEFSDALAAVGLAFFAGLVWLLRIEGKTNQNVRDIARHESDLKELQIVNAKISDDLTAIREATAGIKGYLAMPERNKN